MPEEPDEVKVSMRNFTKRNVPHFFMYAKDKDERQVENVNGSLVNRFEQLIPSPKISIKDIRDGKRRKIGKPDYRLLMHNPNMKIDTDINKHPVIIKYNELVRTYSYKLNAISENCSLPAEIKMKSKIKQQLLYKNIIEDVTNEIAELGFSDVDVVDILVKYLYCDKKDSDRKDLLWACYGDIVLDNLKSNKNKCNFSKDVQCVDCGKWFYIDKKDNNICRCLDCRQEHKRELKRLEMKRYRDKKRNGLM